MELHPAEFGDAQPIDGIGPGFFRIGGKVWQGAVIVWPQGATGWGGLSDEAGLLALAGRADVVFIGMGAEMALLPEALATRLRAAGLMPEPMASDAAARSYNVLLAEGRRVACALLPR